MEYFALPYGIDLGQLRAGELTEFERDLERLSGLQRGFTTPKVALANLGSAPPGNAAPQVVGGYRGHLHSTRIALSGPSEPGSSARACPGCACGILAR